MAARRDFSHSLRLRRSSSFSFSSLQNRLQFTYYTPMENSSSSFCSRRPNRKLLMIEILSRRPPPNAQCLILNQSFMMVVLYYYAQAKAEKSEEMVHFPNSLFRLFFEATSREFTTTAKFVARGRYKNIYVGHRARFIPKIIIICFS